MFEDIIGENQKLEWDIGNGSDRLRFIDTRCQSCVLQLHHRCTIAREEIRRCMELSNAASKKNIT